MVSRGGSDAMTFPLAGVRAGFRAFAYTSKLFQGVAEQGAVRVTSYGMRCTEMVLRG
jgi:hypothetical protein